MHGKVPCSKKITSSADRPKNLRKDFGFGFAGFRGV